MDYASTRNKNLAVSSAFAIKTGLAPDGGLFIPKEIPHVSQDDIMALTQMTYPERAACPSPRLDLLRCPPLEFFPVDDEAFPCLSYAREALRRGRGAATALNAANEVVVDAFLHERIRFCDIPGLVTRVTEQLSDAANLHLYEEILSADRAARETARALLSRI